LLSGYGADVRTEKNAENIIIEVRWGFDIFAKNKVKTNTPGTTVLVKLSQNSPPQGNFKSLLYQCEIDLK
jgi:hypothetical protein